MSSYVGTISTPKGPVESWPIVEHEGELWHVAPVYLAPVARADIEGLCDAWGCEVPMWDLVDAIWQAADVKLSPNLFFRNPKTFTNMATLGAYESQRRIIEARLPEQFEIAVGMCKDFARLPDWRVDLYGWFHLNGEPIEKGATSHNATYCDYSQGLRLVRRVQLDTTRAVSE